MGKNNGKKRDNGKLVRVILLNVIFVLFGLCAVGSGTYAWFAGQRSASVEAGAFTIAAPDGVSFSLYYLDYFCDSSGSKTADGNYDTAVSLNCGYETEGAYAHFASVDSVAQGSWDPTVISHLWPAHQLTFCLAITSGDFSDLTLSSWTEDHSASNAMATPLLDSEETENVNVSISWAINMYGHAYRMVPDGSSSIAGGIGTAYSAYHYDRTHTVEVTDPEDSSKTIERPICPDRFSCSQGAPAPVSNSIVNASIDLREIAVESSATAETIVFFTIEFSNASDTFYRLVSSGNPDLYSRDPSGNSNCYEKLQLTSLDFSLS